MLAPSTLFRSAVVALAALGLGVIAEPGQAQLPVPVPGKHAIIQRSRMFTFRERVAWEQAHPVLFREPVAIPAPLTIAGRLTELEPAEVNIEGGDEPQEDTSVHNLYSPAPSASFLGIVDNASTIPPDTQGAVGPNHVMTILNSQVQMQDKTGVIKYGPVSLNTFCGSALASGNTAYDPHLTYDAATGHWIAIIDAANFSNFSNSRIFIFISNTSDPTGSWFYYNILTDSGANFSDYPTLGFSNNWITVTVNKFAVNSGKVGGFVKATVFAFNRAQAEAGSTLNYWSWDDTHAFTINPVVTLDSGVSTQYMVMDDGGNARLRISTITGAVSSPGYTAAAAYANGVSTWTGLGSSGPQAGYTDKVDTGDSRIINSVYRNGYIWCSHAIGLPASGPTRTAVQWWQVSPTGTVNQEGRLDDSTGATFRAFPSIAVNTNNDVLIGYARFTSGTYPSAYYAFHKSTDAASTLESEAVLKAGEAPYAKYYGGSRNRWGDYSATVVDPSDNLSFWSLQEYAKAPSSTWSTWWVHVPNVVPIVPQSLTLNPSTILGGHNGLGVVTMSAPTTAATPVTLSSSNTAVVNFPLGTTVTVAKGATTAHFAFKAYNVTSSTPVMITATANGTATSATETVVPLGLSLFLVSPSSIEGGAPTYMYVYLTGAAKTGGYSVTLTNSNPGVVSAPTTILIPAGASAVAIPLDTNLVATTTTVNFTAAAGGTTLTASLTLVP